MTSKEKFTEVQRTKFEVRTKRKDLLSLYADGGKMKHNYLLVLKCSISFEMIKFNQAGLFVLVSTIDRLPTPIVKPKLASPLLIHIKRAKQYTLQIISSRCLPKETNEQTCQRCKAQISQISGKKNRLLI